MATTSPSSGIRRIQSRRKSPAYEFPSIFDEFRASTAVDRMQTTPPFTRRSSKRRSSEGRSPSHGRPQDSHGVLDSIPNFFGGVGPAFTNYILPLAAWLFTLGNVALTFVVVFRILPFLVEHTELTTDTAQLQRPECWALSQSSGFCWSFPNHDVHTDSADNPAEAILGEYTRIGASAQSELPSAQIEKARVAAERTAPVISRALSQVENMKITSLRGEEVASLTRKWDEKHQTSDEQFQFLLDRESAFRSHMLLTVRFLASLVAQHEAELFNSAFWGRLYAWAPPLFPGTAAAIITRDLENFAREQATHAKELAKIALRVRNALKKEDDTRASLKITLPLNWSELGEEVDFEELQNFLQHGSEEWIQNALEVADAFRTQYRQLSDQYNDTFTNVKERLRNWNDRAALVDFMHANMASIKQSLAESERRLAARSQG